MQSRLGAGGGPQICTILTVGIFYTPSLPINKMASNPLFGILWIVLLSFLAWPVAALCAGIWVVLMVSLHVGRVHILYSRLCIIIIIFVLIHHILLFSIPKQPFEACCSCTADINKTLEDFTTWPKKCGHAIKNCSSACPSPN